MWQTIAPLQSGRVYLREVLTIVHIHQVSVSIALVTSSHEHEVFNYIVLEKLPRSRQAQYSNMINMHDCGDLMQVNASTW